MHMNMHMRTCMPKCTWGRKDVYEGIYTPICLWLKTYIRTKCMHTIHVQHVMHVSKGKCKYHTTYEHQTTNKMHKWISNQLTKSRDWFGAQCRYNVIDRLSNYSCKISACNAWFQQWILQHPQDSRCFPCYLMILCFYTLIYKEW